MHETHYNGTVVTVYGGSIATSMGGSGVNVIYNVALLHFLRFITGTYPLGRKFKRQHCNIHMCPPLHSSERYALRCCVVDSAQSHVSKYYRSQTMSGIYARSFFFLTYRPTNWSTGRFNSLKNTGRKISRVLGCTAINSCFELNVQNSL